MTRAPQRELFLPHRRISRKVVSHVRTDRPTSRVANWLASAAASSPHGTLSGKGAAAPGTDPTN